MADTREISEEYTNIGMFLIDTEEELIDLKNSAAQVVFLKSQHKKVTGDKLVFGQCEKVPEKYKWGIPADYTVTIFEPNIEGFNDNQLKILILHELMHIDIDMDSDGNEVFKIKHHDLEDFKYIIDRFGTGWAEV